MSVDLFFAAPLVVQDAEADVRETIRDKVYAYLESEKARQDITPAPEESVSTSFYRREASILVDAGLDELEQLILSTARSYLEKTLGLAARPIEIEHAWINLFEPGSQEGQHTHDGSLLSCSYYVDAPANCGCIVFPDPIGARRSYREFTKTSGEDLLTRREIAVEPQPGRFVMFESWMPHYIQCNKSDKVRISIAINLREAAPRREAVASRAAAARGAEHSASSETGETQSHSASQLQHAAPRPFLFNEVFAVNTDLKLDLRKVEDQIPVAVIDNVLTRPADARELVGSAPAANWKHEEGGRNFVDYYDCRQRFPIRHPNGLVALAQHIITQVSGTPTRPADASVDINWFMQINDKRADYAVPHNDITEKVTRSFTCVLYLNDPDECSGGTAFFRFKPSGSLVLDEPYVQAVNNEAGIGESGYDYWDKNPHLWEHVGSVEMQQGRLIIFPSEYFHAAWHPVDSFFEFPRLTLAFWMIA